MIWKKIHIYFKFFLILLVLVNITNSSSVGTSSSITNLEQLKIYLCEKFPECKKATHMNEQVIGLYFRSLGIQDVNLESIETIILDNMKLRSKLYGVCNTEQGQYLSFVKDGDILTKSQCLFDTELDELKAKQHIGTSHSKSVISYSHPCFEEEGETIYVILLFILFFLVIDTIINVYDNIGNSRDIAAAAAIRK